MTTAAASNAITGIPIPRNYDRRLPNIFMASFLAMGTEGA
jgi:hypothetical protein